MKKIFLSSVALPVVFLLACSGQSGSSDTSNVTRTTQVETTETESLPFENYLKYDTFTLENGLRVIVHEDRTVPAISVTSTFHVGSKNESEGKTGFAHLFEHLLFNGTENAPGEFFTYLKEIGASGTNGTTNYDRTNYFQTVPTGALERMLWLESDRMTTFLDGLTEEGLRTQIDVVKNEKGLGDNRPFGKAIYDQIAYLYPKNHPYSRSVIGSIEDLENATLEDAQKWFRDYYGARNTVLVLSGDVNIDEARPLVEKYFNRMEPGPGISRPKAISFKRMQNTVQVVTDIATESSLERAFILPTVIDRESYLPSVALNVFASGQDSELYKILVEEKKLAKSAFVYSVGGELTNAYTISVIPVEGVTTHEVSKALDEALQSFFNTGPSREEIKRYQGQVRSLYINASENLQLKANILSNGMIYHNDPHFDLKTVKWMNSANAEELKQAAKEWLSSGYHETHKIAVDEADAVASYLDFSKMPDVLPTPKKELREPERFKLSNGLEVVFVERKNSPRIMMDYISPVGRTHYPVELGDATALLTQFLRNGGAGGVDRRTLSTRKSTIGANIFASVLRDYTSIALSTDMASFDDALAIWSDVIQSPNFDQDDYNLFKEQSLQNLLSDLKDPGRVGAQVAGLKIYGDDVFQTTQDRIEQWEDPEKLQKAKLFFEENIRPENARLYVVGGIDKNALEQKLEQSLKNWQGRVEQKNIVMRALPAKNPKPHFILLNDEGSTQTRITAMRTLPLDSRKDLYVERLVNEIWGGGFTSRLNLNLREDKAWTYGISSTLRPVPEMDSSWIIGGTVTGKETVNAVKEIVKEIKDINTSRPASTEELNDVVTPKIKSFSNNLGLTFVLPRLYSENDRLGKPHSYIGDLESRLLNLSPQDIMNLVPEIIRHDDLTWILVGDLDLFEDELRKANIGSVEVYNLNGQVIR